MKKIKWLRALHRIHVLADNGKRVRLPVIETASKEKSAHIL